MVRKIKKRTRKMRKAELVWTVTETTVIPVRVPDTVEIKEKDQ